MSDINSVTAPFSPLNGPTASTVSLTVAVTSSQVALPQQAASGNYGAQATAGPSVQIQVYNSGTAVAFVAFGNAATAVALTPAGATAGSYPVAPGAVVVLTVAGNPAYAAAISGTASGVIYFTPGSGT
jgi:hypothetical protein